MSFPGTFFHIKIWRMKIQICSQSANAFSCFLLLLLILHSLYKHTKVTFKKRGKYFITKFIYVTLRLRKRYLFFMCRTWNIFSMCHHEENMQRWYAVYFYFPSSATWKCIFPKQSIFLYFLSSLISTFQTAFSVPFLKLFRSFCFFWRWEKMENEFFSRNTCYPAR